MSVFLRWGVFGILAVAALIYAYNASKRLAQTRGSAPPAAASAAGGQRPARSVEMTEQCLGELRVAQRALEARREKLPMDKLLRSQVIAFEDDRDRRQRLIDVAADWYLLDGEEPSEAELREAVIEDCEGVNPAP